MRPNRCEYSLLTWSSAAKLGQKLLPLCLCSPPPPGELSASPQVLSCAHSPVFLEVHFGSANPTAEKTNSPTRGQHLSLSGLYSRPTQSSHLVQMFLGEFFPSSVSLGELIEIQLYPLVSLFDFMPWWQSAEYQHTRVISFMWNPRADQTSMGRQIRAFPGLGVLWSRTPTQGRERLWGVIYPECGVATWRVSSLNCSLNSSAFYYMKLIFFLKEEILSGKQKLGEHISMRTAPPRHPARKGGPWDSGRWSQRGAWRCEQEWRASFRPWSLCPPKGGFRIDTRHRGRSWEGTRGGHLFLEPQAWRWVPAPPVFKAQPKEGSG